MSCGLANINIFICACFPPLTFYDTGTAFYDFSENGLVFYFFHR